MMKRVESGVTRRVACERAYRRGYTQGAKETLKWLYGALPLTPEMDAIVLRLMDQSSAWQDHLDAWRLNVNERGEMVTPPAIGENS